MKTVWKSFKYPEQPKHTAILRYWEKELDFIPKILELNKEGYRYEWVNGLTIKEQIDNGSLIITQKLILEMKMAMDDIWKKLYKISTDTYGDNDMFLFHGDQHLGNVIWRDDSKELILIDIDSFQFKSYVPISYLNNVFIQQLENYLRWK